eukprot:m.69488 g.69488  ORF g.69488 m.69488 type:complete len:325 (+) comp16780_c0_seq7:382-1356(+)
MTLWRRCARCSRARCLCAISRPPPSSAAATAANEQRVSGVAVSWEAKLLAVAGLPCSLTLFDLDSLGLVERLPSPPHAEHHSLASHSCIEALKFGAGGRLLLTGDVGGLVVVWDVPQRRVLTCLHSHAKRITCIAVTHCGLTAAYGSADTELRVWDLATAQRGGAGGFSPQQALWQQQCVRLLSRHSNTVLGCALSSNGALAISCSSDCTVRLWKPSNRKLIATFYGHSGSVLDCCFSPDDRYILSCSADRTVRVWSRITGALVRLLLCATDCVSCCRWTADGGTIVVGGESGTIAFWSGETLGAIPVSPQKEEENQVVEPAAE